MSLPATTSTQPAAGAGPKRFVGGVQLPDSITKNAALNAAIAKLPPNYNFEIHKTVPIDKHVRMLARADRASIIMTSHEYRDPCTT